MVALKALARNCSEVQCGHCARSCKPEVDHVNSKPPQRTTDEFGAPLSMAGQGLGAGLEIVVFDRLSQCGDGRCEISNMAMILSATPFIKPLPRLDL